ncbi:hypothetical protein [Clostridium botulinum]|uniref:hypothetical protein n=1 Tax=Clostridium botulinum TaxID=1491 RepID=UPI00016B9CC0|nr:hypothetical protein [Clostridium botulinum]EDT84662.1 putative lipoprotein [Clostridium botulinum Bf]
MKKIISLLFIVLISLGLFGCGAATNKDTTASIKQETKQEEKKEPTQEELNEKLKKEAVEADFVKINAGKAKNMKVFAEGKISAVDNESKLDIFPSFMLTQKRENGYGVYHVRNVLSVQGLKDGDTVKIYGIVEEKDKETGMPIISATVIEK